MKPEDIVKQARAQKCQSIAYTYTEPTIFFEYAYETAKIAKKYGILNVFVTNGYMTRRFLQTPLQSEIAACPGFYSLYEGAWHLG